RRIVFMNVDDKGIEVFDAILNRTIFEYRNHPGKLYTHKIVLGPNGKRLAFLDWKWGDVKVVDVDKGEGALTLTGHTNDVIDLVFSPDGKRIASSSGFNLDQPNEVKIWDGRTGQEIFTLHRGHGGNFVHRLAFTPDG